jgi:cation transport regulator ChaC
MAAMIRSGGPLFAYGSLMFPAVIKSVIGRVPKSRPALIKGYRRLVVTGEFFPGLIRINDGSLEPVEGLIYVDVTREEWERVIAFEDDFYELKGVAVESFGERISALAFVVPPSQRSLLSDEVWNPDQFRDRLLRRWADC